MAVIRQAGREDEPFLVQALLSISSHVRKSVDDPYARALPTSANPGTIRFVREYLSGKPDLLALVRADSAGRARACLLGCVAACSQPNVEAVKAGRIEACFTDPAERQRGYARELVQAAETWFAEKGLKFIELSFVPGSQGTAEAWAALGYQPFRQFSFRALEVRQTPRSASDFIYRTDRTPEQ
jgi:GNAT superfamily N-acetyltransferase